MSKCRGCGIELQFEDESKLGFTRKKDSSLCERCFRIKNYNDYKRVTKDNNSIMNSLKQIKKDDLVILVVDIMNIPEKFDLFKDIKNDILLVLSKADLLPSEMYDEKLNNICDSFGINYKDKVLVSANKNYNLDLLMEKINELKKSKEVYFLGYSNSGKSTLLNKIIYDYTDIKESITTSLLPSTTLDLIEIKINENLTIIDTPGLLEEGNLIDVIEPKYLSKIMPRKKINPRIYQIKENQILNVENIISIMTNNCNLVFYISNDLKIEREYNKNIKGLEFDINNEDIVIPGLGFIKVKGKTKVIVKTKYNLKIYKRESKM